MSAPIGAIVEGIGLVLGLAWALYLLVLHLNTPIPLTTHPEDPEGDTPFEGPDFL